MNDSSLTNIQLIFSNTINEGQQNHRLIYLRKSLKYISIKPPTINRSSSDLIMEGKYM
jgi:hypothetical protein